MNARWTKLVLLTLLVVLIACEVDVTSGTVRDTLANIEETEKGNWRVWLTHDTAAGYCTVDTDMGQYALELLKEHDGEVIIEYRSIQSDDPEFNVWSQSDCGSIYKGGSEMEMFMITSITPVNSRWERLKEFIGNIFGN